MDNGAYVGHKILRGLADAAAWVGKELDQLPGPFKNLLAPLHMASEGVSEGLNVADTAVTSAVGLVDPTGIAANAAGNEFRNAIDPSGT